MRFRRLRRATLIVLALAASALALQLVYVDSLHDYLISVGVSSRQETVGNGLRAFTSGNPGQMPATLLSIAKERGSALATEFSRAWGEGAGGHPAPRIASVVFGILAVFGFISIGRREFLYCDAFAACYAAALLILPP